MFQCCLYKLNITFQIKLYFSNERLEPDDDMCGHFDLSLGMKTVQSLIMAPCDLLLGLKA